MWAGLGLDPEIFFVVGNGREGSHSQSWKVQVVLGERFAKHRDDSWEVAGYTRELWKSSVSSTGSAAPGWAAPRWVVLLRTVVDVLSAHVLLAMCVLMFFLPAAWPCYCPACPFSLEMPSWRHAVFLLQLWE